jgi:hypothetical protein
MAWVKQQTTEYRHSSFVMLAFPNRLIWPLFRPAEVQKKPSGDKFNEECARTAHSSLQENQDFHRRLVFCSF